MDSMSRKSSTILLDTQQIVRIFDYADLLLCCDLSLMHHGQVFDEEGRERTPKPMLSLRPNNVRPLPSLIGDSQASVTSDTDRNSMMSEMGHLERLSSAAFSTGSSRVSAGYGSNTLTPELSLGSQMGMNVSGMASGFDSKVTITPDHKGSAACVSPASAAAFNANGFPPSVSSFCCHE